MQVIGFHIYNLVVHMKIIVEVVAEDGCWPAFRHPPSCSLILAPQQADNKMKKIMDSDKDREIIYRFPIWKKQT